jgi:hypothetical protein
VKEKDRIKKCPPEVYSEFEIFQKGCREPIGTLLRMILRVPIGYTLSTQYRRKREV